MKSLNLAFPACEYCPYCMIRSNALHNWHHCNRKDREIMWSVLKDGCDATLEHSLKYIQYNIPDWCPLPEAPDIAETQNTNEYFKLRNVSIVRES